MSFDFGKLQLIREALEGTLAPSFAFSLLQEALQAYDAHPPETQAEILQFVRGSLKERLVARLGHGQGVALVSRMEQMLGAPQCGDTPSTRPAQWDESTTQQLAEPAQPVTVLVVAGSRTFANWLRGELGPLAQVAANDGSHLSQAVASHQPALVLLDSRDAASVELAMLADQLRALPDYCLCAVWGAALPYGQKVTMALDGASLPVVLLHPEEGIEPLLDLVRSRAA